MDKHISAEIQINSNDYYVNMFITDDQKLVIEFNDIYSADSWKGVFESKCNIFY